MAAPIGSGTLSGSLLVGKERSAYTASEIQYFWYNAELINAVSGLAKQAPIEKAVSREPVRYRT